LFEVIACLAVLSEVIDALFVPILLPVVLFEVLLPI